MVVLYFIAFLGFTLYDVMPMIKNKQWKVVIIYSVIMLSAIVFFILVLTGVKLPSPTYAIKKFFESIFGEM